VSSRERSGAGGAGALVPTRDKSDAGESWGCENPSKIVMWRDSAGQLFPVRCGASNRCWYCAYLIAMENAVVVRLDAEIESPNVGLTLTTVTPEHDLGRFRRDVEQAFRFIRAKLGTEVGYLGFMEWTTGRGTNSGGHRRAHIHALLKRAHPASAAALEPDLADLWQSRTGANRVELRELRTAAGAIAYLVHHHHKRDQAPPRGFTGRRLRPSKNYYSAPISELREEAKSLLRHKRLQRAVMSAMDYDLLADSVGEQEASLMLDEAVAHARSVAADGVELVRVQRVPETFGPDGLPATWAVEVLGPFEVRVSA
jgi:hypothetical protein